MGGPGRTHIIGRAPACQHGDDRQVPPDAVEFTPRRGARAAPERALVRHA